MKKLLFVILILFTLSMSLSAVDFTIGPKVAFGDYGYWGSVPVASILNLLEPQ
jgi:hypothetical protein